MAPSDHSATPLTATRDPLPPRPPSRRRRAIWFLVMLILAVVILGGFYVMEQMKQKGMAAYFAGMTPPPTPVETVKAATEDMPQYLESIGTLTAVHQVTVAPEIEGRIAEIKFESGGVSQQNDVLVQLDDASEQADLQSFQAQAKLAQLNLTRARQLATKQFTSKQSVDQIQSDLDQARAGIARAQSEIEHKVIRAPFAGMLGIRQVDLGEYVAAGTAIVSLTDLDELYVDFTLPEQDRAKVAVGQPVEIKVDAYPTRLFKAWLSTIDPQVDATMRAIKLRATLANADHALQPGMYARVSVVLPSEPNVVTLPEPAIDYTVYGESVYIVREGKEKDKDGKPVLVAEQAFVTLGPRREGKVSVVKGVKPGDVVVVGGQLKLHNGAPVTLSPTTSLENPTTVPNE